jgi:uncharacterized protein
VDVQLPNIPVPVFPLRGLYLFPHQLLPLHIFEPRYRRMIADLLDGPGRLVLASPRRGERMRDDAPALQPIAGLGEIMRHEKLPDGRFMVWIVGLCRVAIDEVPSEHPYRLVRCRPFAEVDATADEVEELAPALRAATTERLKEPLPLPDDTPMGLLADLLLQTLGASPTVLERAFAEPSVTMRARYVLRAARRARRADPEPPIEPLDAD